MRRKWRWLIVAVVVASAGMWSTQGARACGGIGPFAINCDGIIIANQITQIAHMVTQIREMGRQLSSMDGVLETTTELITSNDPAMGNLGRLREVTDANWFLQKVGAGLASSYPDTDEGLYSQRVPGLSDEAGWLDILAAPRLGDPASATVLLGGRPATETTPAEDSAFRSWRAPGGAAWSGPGRNAAREAIDVLGDVAEGTATWRTVWDGIEAALPPSVTAADLRALTTDRAAGRRLAEDWRRQERQAAAELMHAHAIAEAASTLTAQIGETAAHLGELRDDDLMRVQRVDQAVLATATTQTELLLAQAQVMAYEQAEAARARYEAARARREHQARRHAAAVRDQAAMAAFSTESRAVAAARLDSYRNALEASGL